MIIHPNIHMNISIFDLPEELLHDILNYLPLNDLINSGLINNFFLAFIKNNNWYEHLISIYSGDEKILEFLLDNYKFHNFRLEALNITDALAQKLTKAWFIRFSYCSIESTDILNQFHRWGCY
jgi:hypothetical protein